MLTFANARLEKGVEIIISYTNLREIVKKANIVFTGEGGIDFQTQYGKTPYGVAKVAKEEGKSVIAIAGYIGKGVEQLYSFGFDAILGIMPGVMTMEEAIESASDNVERTIENIVRILKLNNAD